MRTNETIPLEQSSPLHEPPSTCTSLDVGSSHDRPGQALTSSYSGDSVSLLSPGGRQRRRQRPPRSNTMPMPTTPLRLGAGPRQMTPIAGKINFSPTEERTAMMPSLPPAPWIHSQDSLPSPSVYDPDDDLKSEQDTAATIASTIDTTSVSDHYGDEIVPVAPKKIPRAAVSEETLTFGQFACDAIQSELQVKVVLLYASQVPNADQVYSLMNCEDPLADELCHSIQLVRVKVSRFDLRQLMQASVYDQVLPQVVATTEWDQQWEFVCEQDVDLFDVALPLALLQDYSEVPAIAKLSRRLHQLQQFPRPDDWIPGILLVVRHLCQIHGIEQ